MENINKKYALYAGISIFIMAIAAGFSFGYVHGNLIVEGDVMSTFVKIKDSESLFIIGIIGWILIMICDIIVSVLLFNYLRNISKSISLYTASMRIVYSIILGLAIYQLILVLPNLRENAVVGSPRVWLLLDSFIKIWSAGLIIFGIHLLGLGYLSYLSGFIPKIITFLLLFAGLCYFAIHLAKATLPSYGLYIGVLENVFSLPMALGELVFAFWLIAKGDKTNNLISGNSHIEDEVQ